MPDRSLQGTQPSCGLRAGLQTGPGWGGLGASDSRPPLLVFHIAMFFFNGPKTYENTQFFWHEPIVLRTIIGVA